MTFLVKIPFEVATPLSQADSDVRSIARMPGYVGLELIDRRENRYELTLEVEGGSRRDAVDAADELLHEYEDTLAAYRPRVLATIAPELS